MGDEPSIRALTESVGFHYQYLADIDLFSHPTGIMILTPTGKVSSYFYGTQFLGQDIHLALADASHEKIDSPEVINARMQKGMAGGGTSAGMNPTAKPQCAPPMVNHPWRQLRRGRRLSNKHAGGCPNSKSALPGFRIQESIGEACAHGGRDSQFYFSAWRWLQPPRRTPR